MKSSYHCVADRHKGRSLPFFSMLGALLVLFPLLLPATVLAAPRSVNVTPPFTPPQIVELAGVSVVRLSLTYLPAKGTPAIFCTTLGTIIASWPAENTTEKNTWVLTDGSLLNLSTKNGCASGDKLSSIKVFASNEFTNNQPASSQLAELACASNGVCTDVFNGTNITGPVETILTPVNGAVLFSFHTANPLPFVDVERANTTGLLAPTSIELTDRNGLYPPKNADPTTFSQFLTPGTTTVTPGNAPATPGTGTGSASTPTSEPGMPYIDGNGKITGAQLFNTNALVTISDMLNLEKQPAFPQEPLFSQKLNSNTLSKQWDTGITEYEQGNYRGAAQTLNSIQNAPPAFQAPTAFARKAQAHIPATNGTSGGTSSNANGQSNTASFLGIPTVWALFVGLIAGVLVLVLLFLLVSLIFGRMRLKRKQELESFEADLEAARHIAEQQASFQAKSKQEVSPRTFGMQIPDSKEVNNSDIPVSLRNGEISCPNCGNTIQDIATFCPNCGYSIFPAKSPQMQDDLAIQAALQRLWDKAGR